MHAIEVERERVEELLGLDCDAFLRTVILPQGRFARLLVEDEPKARSAILRQVWRTDELEAVGEQAVAAYQLVRELRIRVEEAAKRHPEDPERYLDHLRESLAQATSQAVAAGRDKAAAEDDHEAMRTAADEVAKATRVRERLDSVDGLAPLAKRARAFDQQEHELLQRWEELRTERDAIPTEDGPTSEQVGAALTALPGIKNLLIHTEKAAADLRTGIDFASEQRSEAERLEQLAADARERSREHASARPPLEKAVLQAQERLDEVKQSLAACAARETDIRAADRRLEELRKREASYATPLATAREEETRSQAQAAEAQEHFAVARRSHSAAHAARDLHSGDSCPVCRRTLPADWEAPAESGLEHAERIAEEARLAASAASQEVIRLDAQLQGIHGQVREATAALTDCEARSEEARLALAIAIDPDAPLPDQSTILTPLKTTKGRAEAALAEHDRAAKQLRDDASTQGTAAEVGRRDAENADKTTMEQRQAAADRLHDLTAALLAVPEPFRPAVNLPADAVDLEKIDAEPLTRKTESANARKAVLRERQRELERISSEIRKTETSQTSLAKRRADELDAPLSNLAQHVAEYRDALLDSANRLGLDREIAPSATTDAGALAKYASDLETARGEVASAAASLAADAANKAEAARARFRTLGERLGNPLGDPESLLRLVRDRADDARYRERAAGREEKRFAAIVADVRQLRTLLDEITEKEHALSDLADALKAGRFLKWLTLRRSRELLIFASRKLKEVSGGRYSFVDPQDTDEQWRILDNDSNRPRTPASLSGGEQFLASLSLALGMVEMMERTGGRLESLFLDEGFGSLDARNLDSAIQALETAATKRMVAVISHVRAVAEQIDHVLAVTREARGSRAAWLSAHERERLAASDAETSALAGLLD